MERTCKKCGETKPIEDFPKDTTNKYSKGHKYTCKSCCHISSKKWRVDNAKEYRELNKARINEYFRNYYQNNKNKLKEIHKVSSSKHRNKYPNKIKERNKTQYLKNQKYNKIRAIKYQQEHIEQHKINGHNLIIKLPDSYVISKLERMGLNKHIIEQYPDLIDLKRVQIKILRLTKNQNV